MKKLIACLLLVFLVSGCASKDEQISMDRNPIHHTNAGFKNNPFVETAAPKGFLFYMRRFWGSVFTPEIPEGHAISSEE